MYLVYQLAALAATNDSVITAEHLG